MLSPAIYAADGATFRLTLKGEERVYANDKEGKRQAILDALQTLPPVTAEGQRYLASNAVLQAIAAVLYPDGIQTEAAYNVVCQTAAKACAHLGYDAEVELGPPCVPFTDRGRYWQKAPAVDGALVADGLAQAGVSGRRPQREMARSILWNKIAWETRGCSWSGLTPAQQEALAGQIDDLAAAAGWQIDREGDQYAQPLPADLAGARRTLDRYLAEQEGRPLSDWSVIDRAQQGAYGRSFYDAPLSPPLQRLVEERLAAHGYETAARDGVYQARPVDLSGVALAELVERLAALPTVETAYGPVLPVEKVTALAQALSGAEALSVWQAEEMLRRGRLSQALQRLGYENAPISCPPRHFRPPLAETEAARQVIRREVRVSRNARKTLSLAQGLAVYAPALALDDGEDTIVYLEMVGPKQSVKANWAALAGGGKTHWLGSRRIRLAGMRAHLKLANVLPCGWVNWALIHKQASLKEMNPEEPFYLLDDGRRRLPALFYPMLNKALALPLLPDWSDYLWQSGRQRQLITLLDEGKGQGYAAWRVLPAAGVWEEIVTAGVGGGDIAF